MSLSFLYYHAMNKNILKADLLLFLAAAIWGTGFVAQRSGMQYIGPFAFNGLRFILASLFLIPFSAWHIRRATLARTSKTTLTKSTLAIPSLLAGSCLFVAVSLQQMGILFTTAGNAGFITGLYVVFTPILGIFLGRKTGPATWAGTFLTFTGLFLLSFDGGTGSLNLGDILVAISSLFWAFHVLCIDRLVQTTNPVALSSGQFAVAGLFSLIAAFVLEAPILAWVQNIKSSGPISTLQSWESFPALISGLASGAIPSSLVSNALLPVLYGGLVSGGIGYTFQVMAQRHSPPAHTTVILCLEGCFAVLGGVILLSESVGIRTLVSFAFILSGILASQWELLFSRRRVPDIKDLPMKGIVQ